MRGDITRPSAVDRAVFENSRGVSKDEIHVSFDIAGLVILPAAVREERVLPSEKATVTKYDPIGIDVSSDGLRAHAVSILKRDVLSPKVTAAKVGAVRKPRIA